MVILYGLLSVAVALLLYILFLSVCALLVDPEKEYENNSRFYRFLLDSATAAAIKLLRIRVHISGTEKLPENTMMLFVCNHRSNFDPIVTWYALKKWRIAFISKPENFRVPFFGRIIRKCCFMPIDRENPRNAIVTIHRAADLLKRQEVSVGVYPEGTRSKTGQMLPFRNGVFKIAQKSGASIAVLSIVGTPNISRRTPFRGTDVFLDVLEVFPAESIHGDRTENIGAAARHLIETNIKKRENDGKRICDL